VSEQPKRGATKREKFWALSNFKVVNFSDLSNLPCDPVNSSTSEGPLEAVHCLKPRKPLTFSRCPCMLEFLSQPTQLSIMICMMRLNNITRLTSNLRSQLLNLILINQKGMRCNIPCFPDEPGAMHLDLKASAKILFISTLL
jgi:hypothetical protein